MNADILVRTLAMRGVRLAISGENELRVEGAISDAEIEMVRESKSDVIELLRRQAQKPTADFGQLSTLSHLLGKPVSVLNWGTGILWGISPHGAIVDVGNVLITFDLDEVKGD